MQVNRVLNLIIMYTSKQELQWRELRKRKDRWAAALMSFRKMIYLVVKAGEIIIKIKDEGVGIENVHKAMEPLYTTKPELERSGMGFSFMEAFMDELNVYSRKNVGTTVIMKKRIGESNR